mgnify:CR=1 FL=1
MGNQWCFLPSCAGDLSRGHPLLFHFIGGCWIKLFDDSLFSMHSFAFTLSIILFFSCFFIGFKLFGPLEGFFVAVGTITQNLVFGQSDPVLTYSGSTGSSNATFTAASDTTASSANAKLNLAAGALGDAPVERSLVAIGQAPANIGTSADPVDASTSSKERVYVARRVVQVEVTSHGLKRDTATVFPVQFRCLPDDNDLYDGAEYGVIIDRVYSSL